MRARRNDAVSCGGWLARSSIVEHTARTFFQLHQRRLERLRRLSLERERDVEDDEELYEDEDEEYELDELDVRGRTLAGRTVLDEYIATRLDEDARRSRSFGHRLRAVFNHSRMSSVSAPREMDVKKLMLNLVREVGCPGP